MIRPERFPGALLFVSWALMTCVSRGPLREPAVSVSVQDPCAAKGGTCICVCRPGFVDGGQRCEDIDECASNHGGCDPRTTCTNTRGARTCGACPVGFQGDGAAGCREPHWPIPPDSPPSSSYSVDLTAGTVEHRATGLVWQRSVPPGEFQWQAALTYCDALTLGGDSDWRLPTLTELASIFDLGRTRPAIDPDAFPDTPSEAFWSLSVNWQGYPSRLDFSIGLWTNLPDDEKGHRVRCVRQNRTPAKGDRYLVTADTVLDRTSGLTWQRAVTALKSRTAEARSSSLSPSYYPFQEAEEYCRDLEFAGFSNWRLPTLKELMSLLEPEAAFGEPTIDTTAFPATPALPFWSSSPAVLVPGEPLIVSFSYGTAWPNKLAHVRCVR